MSTRPVSGTRRTSAGPAISPVEPLEPRTLLAAAAPVPAVVALIGEPNATSAARAHFHSGLGTDQFGNVYVAGSFDGTIDLNPDPEAEFLMTASDGGEGNDNFLAKYDPQGRLQWVNRFWAKGERGGGGVWSPSLGVSRFGMSYLAFPFEGTLDADPGAGAVELRTKYKGDELETALAVVQIDINGRFANARKLHTRNQGMQPIGVGTDDKGWVYVAAESFVRWKPPAANVQDYDTVLYAMSPNLEDRYAHRWGAKGRAVHAESLAVNPDGSVFIAGQTWTGLDFHPSRRRVRRVPDGFEDRNTYLLRVNPRGQFDWVIGLAGPEHVAHEFTALAADGEGGVYAAGRFGPGVDFNPARRRTFAPEPFDDRYRDAFVARYTAGGALARFWSLGEDGDMYEPHSLAVDPATGNIAVAGGLGAQSWEQDPAPGQRLAGSGTTAFFATYTPAGEVLGARAISYSGFTITPGRTLIPAFADDVLYLLGHTHLQTLETYAPGEGNRPIDIGKRGVYLLKVE